MPWIRDRFREIGDNSPSAIDDAETANALRRHRQHPFRTAGFEFVRGSRMSAGAGCDL
jgi:hypothetical protein